MPTYEYLCEACNHRFEKFQSITSAPIKKCPECGKSKVRRLIGTGAGLLFKGSGFYITDYRNESYNKAAKADAPGGGESKNGDGKSGDAAKPAASSSDAPATTTPAAAPAKAESKPATPAKKEGKSPKK